MLDLFKGQLSLDDIKGMTYKEAYMLRDIRIKKKIEQSKKGPSLDDVVSEIENNI